LVSDRLVKSGIGASLSTNNVAWSLKNHLLNVMYVCFSILQLPPLRRSYCDGDIVRSVAVLVEHYNESIEYHINDHVKTKNEYKLMLSFSNHSSYFWKTLNISLSVNNTKGASPLSTPYLLRGAIKNSKYIVYS